MKASWVWSLPVPEGRHATYVVAAFVGGAAR